MKFFVLLDSLCSFSSPQTIVDGKKQLWEINKLLSWLCIAAVNNCVAKGAKGINGYFNLPLIELFCDSSIHVFMFYEEVKTPFRSKRLKAMTVRSIDIYYIAEKRTLRLLLSPFLPCIHRVIYSSNKSFCGPKKTETAINHPSCN